MTDPEHTPEIDTQWFQDRLRANNLSYRKLAKNHLHLDASAVSLMMRGRRRMSMDEAVTIARLIGHPVTEVMRRAGIDPGESTVRIVGTLDGNGNVDINWNREQGRVIRPPDVPRDTAAIACRTGMGPLQMMDGTVIYFRGDGQESIQLLDRWCIVQLNSGQYLARYVRRGYRDDTFNLFSWGCEDIYDVPLRWGSSVLWQSLM